MESGSILETIGHEIIAVMAPVSVCMLLVVLLVYTVYNPSAAATTIRTAANLVYDESTTDSTSQKLEGAILNAIVFVLNLTIVTFLVLLLYYYRFKNFLIYFNRFSVFTTFSAIGSSIFISIIHRFNIPIDAVTFYILLFNFTVLGTISMYYKGIPIILKQSTMVVFGIILAVWFSRFPEWTTWAMLVALALYDLVAVLAPGGPLKLMVQLAKRRGDELPALAYESRPNVGRNGGARESSLGVLVTAGIGSETNNNNSSVELLRNGDRNNNREREHLIIAVDQNGGENAGETSPLMGDEGERMETKKTLRWRGIKLGMGDFVFYSVLVAKAAMYDLMTVYACYLGIMAGLGCTLILLAVFRRALPALPISITLGVIFYFLTRLLMEPFVVGASTNLMMF